MSRHARQPRADHQAAADRLRAQPGVWGAVHDYRSTGSAEGIAGHIRTAFLVAYNPPGSFEACTEQTGDGTRVHARYIGEGDGR